MQPIPTTGGQPPVDPGAPVLGSQPPDTLVVGLHRTDLTDEEVAALRDQLSAAVPELRTVLIAGASALFVHHAPLVHHVPTTTERSATVQPIPSTGGEPPIDPGAPVLGGRPVRNRHAATVHLARTLVANRNLPEGPRQIALRCEALAGDMIDILPDGPELTAGLRKLREAKDCFVVAFPNLRDLLGST